MAEGKGGQRAALAQARQKLAGLAPKQKLDALIDSEHAQALVRSVPAPELYYAIVEVGLQDATDIVGLASPAQFRAFVDLGGWKRDRLDPHEVLTWLRAAHSGSEQDEFLKKLEAIDLEVIEHLLRAFVTVHDLEEDPDVNPPGVTMESPEGRYLLELHAEGVELAALRSLLGELFARNPFETVRLLEATRWELPSELEETAFRFRTGRLGDLGFPAAQDAAAIFAWTDPEKVSRPAGAAASASASGEASGDASRASGLVKSPSGGTRVDYAEAALRALEPTERENFEAELVELANAALVAEVGDPGDLDAVRRTGELVRDYLNLALEHLCAGDAALAVECVREHPARKLFQLGFSLTLQLKFAVDRLWKEPLSHVGQTWLVLSALANVLGALRRRRPLRALAVEGAEPVPFRSRRELDEAMKRVERARVQVRVFRALLGGTEEAARERLLQFSEPLEVLGTERLLAAAVAQAVLDGEVRAAPVPKGRVPELFERLVGPRNAAAAGVKSKVRAETTERVHAAFAKSLGDDDAAVVEACVLGDAILARLAEEWGTQWLTEGNVGPQVAEIVPLAAEAGL